ncbi:unnamed protein product [Schistosoma bovis]|uniref:Cyclin N-terminal domain-containing protein n=1 Tax=Schistosoma bovis TaxID=6184 RepID=A0A430Q6C5_SCHBO|nr:uncharacterized protein DC041_0013044 [Schistosoma bovis]CAH8636228.1 unnamed protein product [Schistosoma bovis]CAH8641454.1 unnamed protein product [Schistosoma bovis]
MDDLTNEELQKWLKFSNQPDPKYIKPYSLYRGLFYSENVCDFVMNLCRLLKAPDEVAFKTIEMFDRFLLLYFKNLSFEEWITNFDQPCLPKKKKIILFLITVLQVVTKLIYRHKILKTSDAEKVMLKLGHPSIKNEIIDAELCVLNTLQDSLMYRTLEECIEFLAVVFTSKDSEIHFPHKKEVMFYVYCKYNYLNLELKKYNLLFKSSTHTLILLGSAVLFSCLILNNHCRKINVLRLVVKSLGIVSSQDVLKATFILLKSI